MGLKTVDSFILKPSITNKIEIKILLKENCEFTGNGKLDADILSDMEKIIFRFIAEHNVSNGARISSGEEALSKSYNGFFVHRKDRGLDHNDAKIQDVMVEKKHYTINILNLPTSKIIDCFDYFGVYEYVHERENRNSFIGGARL